MATGNSYRQISERTEETAWRKDGKVMIVTMRAASPDGETLTSTVRVRVAAEPENIVAGNAAAEAAAALPQ